MTLFMKEDTGIQRIGIRRENIVPDDDDKIIPPYMQENIERSKRRELFKIKVTYTNQHDESLKGGDWDTYFASNKYSDYFKEFDTKEELGCFILDLVDKENIDVIVCPINKDEDYRELEIYNDYRE